MDCKHDLLRHYQWLRRYGYNDSHSGNVSVRDGDTIWVTPTGACADTLQADELIACDINGRIGDGASLDAALHLQSYRNNDRIRCLLHSHGPYSVAMTMNGRDFVPVDFEGQYYFQFIPVLDIPYDRYLSDAAAQVAEALREHPVVIVRGHGVYAAAETINLAYKWTCSLELSAKTGFIARQAGTISP